MHMPPHQDTNFELPPEGSHLAVCYRVIDLGTQKQDWQGQTKLYRKVLLSWELPQEKMEDGRPFAISQRYTLSSSEKAKLRKDLEAWRGKKFTPEDFGPNGFDIKNVLGKGCLLGIVHNQKDDKTYANIAAIMSLPKGTANGAQPQNELLYLSLDPNRFDRSIFEKLTDNLRETISSSPEYRELMGGPPPHEPPTTHEFDDEIPF